MARYQYTIDTAGNWQSSFGNALFALTNKSGSGRRFVIRRFAVQVQSWVRAEAGGTQGIVAELVRGTNLYGTSNLYNAKHDSVAADLPSDVSVQTSVCTDATEIIDRVSVHRWTGAIGAVYTLGLSNIGRHGYYRRTSKRITSSPVEPLKVRAGEVVALIPNGAAWSAVGSPVVVGLSLLVNAKSYTFERVVSPAPGQALIAVANASGSTETVQIAQVTITHQGTVDTPYMRVVPVGQIYADYVNDATRKLAWQIQRKNSATPAWDDAWGDVYADVPFIPYGVPENYLTETTAGTPRGFNYLHTKDFNGPMWQAFFPEGQSLSGAQATVTDRLNWNVASERGALLGMEGLTINEGEGIAIVGSAETATTGATYSGWPALRYRVTFDVMPAKDPVLSLAGLQSGSDIVVLEPGTSTEYQNVDANAGTSWSWQYDPDVVSDADICIYKAGYRPYIIRGVALGVDGLTVPVAQAVDPAYLNP